VWGGKAGVNVCMCGLVVMVGGSRYVCVGGCGFLCRCVCVYRCYGVATIRRLPKYIGL